MSRNRLTNRTASEGKPATDNDVYKMNNPEHEKNDPKIDEYAKGDPSAWAEDVNKDKVNKDDQKREDTGHAPLVDKHAAQEAIANVRRLEEKAVKAIIASQRMLPGATDELIEKQASILMHLPEEGLNSTLSNQESLAKLIAKAASDSCEDEKEEKEEKEAAEDKVEEKEEKEEKEAAEDKTEEKKEESDEACSKEALQQKLANLKKQAEEVQALLDGSKEAAKEEVEEKEEKEAAEDKVEEKEEEKKEESVEASDASLLDQIFSGVLPSPIKKGASKLSGMVKKEASSAASNDLSGIWASAPDVSQIFN